MIHEAGGGRELVCHYRITCLPLTNMITRCQATQFTNFLYSVQIVEDTHAFLLGSSHYPPNPTTQKREHNFFFLGFGQSLASSNVTDKESVHRIRFHFLFSYCNEQVQHLILKLMNNTCIRMPHYSSYEEFKHTCTSLLCEEGRQPSRKRKEGRKMREGRKREQRGRTKITHVHVSHNYLYLAAKCEVKYWFFFPLKYKINKN